MADLNSLVKEIFEVDNELKILNARRKELRADIVRDMEENKQDAYTVDGVATATLSKPKTLKLDTGKLMELATPEVVEMVTSRVIDKTKLEAAMKIDAIGADVVDAISSYEPQTPRLTVRKASKGD